MNLKLSAPIWLALLTLAVPHAHATSPVPAPAAAAPATPAAATSPSRKLPKVLIENLNIGEMIDLLNKMAETSNAPQINVVADQTIKAMGLPNMTLQNVTTADVLQVASQVAHLQVKVVPSDSNGTVAAYILERAQPANLTLEVGPREGSLGGMGGGTGGGGLGLPVNRDALDSPPTQPAGLGGGGGSEASGGSMPAGAPSPADPSASRPVVPWSHSYAKPAPQAKVTRVLGIAELTKDIPDKALRNDNESEIIKNLKIMSEEHSLRTDVPDCDIQLHAGMHLLVVIGHPDSVALIEQAVAALKENASKSTGTTAPTKPFDTPLTH